MSDTNQATFSGNLTRDAELKTTNSGKPVLNFCIANNTGFGDFEQTNFIDCCMFGDRAEKLAPHLAKGKPVICSGEHVQSIWNDKDTGKERRRFELKVFNLTFQRGDKGERREESRSVENTNYDRAQAQVAAGSPTDGDSIPF